MNRRIVENHPVRPFVTTREYAAEIGALAFFEEKYGEFVRVLEIDDFSRELCGGTHVSSTSQIGVFKITASSSVGANARRIEAITSAKGIEHYRGVEDALAQIADELGVHNDRAVAAVRKLREQLADAKEKLRSGVGDRLGPSRRRARQRAAARRRAARGRARSTERAPDELLELADEVRAKLGDVVAVLMTAARRSRGRGGRRLGLAHRARRARPADPAAR